MEFKIIDNATKPKYFNAYVVEMKAMYGDDDGEGFLEIGGFKKGEDEILLKDLIRTCEDMHFTEGCRMDEVKGFDKWFNTDKYLGESSDKLSNKMKVLSKRWLTDPFNYEYATLSTYKAFYYDENGVKFNVEIVQGLEDSILATIREYEGYEMTAEDGVSLLEELRDVFEREQTV
ncbi:hypothetical protein [Priestia megaterium]|uniref:hypothetical protein n=1 Tax=Priestia megaterium TaxID=1404 RepID=UPI000BFC9D9E|nr:hypothetical protein [Priestia megaterium]PGO60576.1 hypothetical protein CN981_08490 [Priestia megaterium]